MTDEDERDDAANPNEGRTDEEEQIEALADKPVSHEGPATVRTVAALIPQEFG